MADKKDDKKKDDKKKKTHHSSGGLSFGVEIIIFLVILFIVWAFFTKPSEDVDKPFIKAETTPSSQE
ncbi:MAG: hypothetical protein WCW65_01365 [Candidatus Paceibacterota bacterium]